MFELRTGDNFWAFFSGANKNSPCTGSAIVGDVYLKYHFYDIDLPLVITFSNAGEVTKTSESVNPTYSPWGFDFVDGYNVNVLSFSCFKNANWYRSSDFQDFILSLSEPLSMFKTRLGYGGSMGGFGISSFSNSLGLNCQLLMNPITSLSPNLVPWETRFNMAKELNWQTGFIDGADSTCKSIIVYDPLFKLDSLHARRYKNSIKLKLPGVGHGIPKHLNNLRVLKFTFEQLLLRKVDIDAFQKLVRNRRYYDGYYNWMLSPENTHLTVLRKHIIKSYQNKVPKAVTSKQLNVEEHDVDVIRDLAMKLENINLEEAYKLMSIAYRLRPHGKVIAERLSKYKLLLEA